jgi:hypothetical protein
MLRLVDDMFLIKTQNNLGKRWGAIVILRQPGATFPETWLLTNMNSKRKLDDPDWSEAEDDTRDTSKKGQYLIINTYVLSTPLLYVKVS